MAKLQVHPFAALLPFASDEEYRHIRDDIRANGLKVPLLIFNEKLLDGRTREEACNELGISPSFEYIRGTARDALKQVQSLNVFRRHLSQSQKAAVAERISCELQKLDGLSVKESRLEAAKATGASYGTVRDAATIRSASPKLADEVVNGKTTVAEAIRVLRPIGIERRAARLCASAKNDLQKAIRLIKRYKCPEKDRMERILLELTDLDSSLLSWATRREGK